MDESREQTRAILAFQRRRQTLEGHAESSDVQAILRRHHNFQRLLKPLAVVNPKARELGFTDDRLQSRRDQPKYLNLIAATAFLRQMAKPRKQAPSETGTLRYVEVDQADLDAATELACEIMGRSLGDLNSVSRDLLMQAGKMVDERVLAIAGQGERAPRATEIEFTRRDIREYTGWPHARIERYLKRLVDLEYINAIHGQNGHRYVYRLIYEGQGELPGRFLPGADPNLLKASQLLLGTFSVPKTKQVTEPELVAKKPSQNPKTEE